MRIELAKQSDVCSVMDLISCCTAHMCTNGIYQWDKFYPNLAVVTEDARNGSLFLIRHGATCIASICLNEAQPDEYHGIWWRSVEGHALIVHRLCVHPDWQGKGIGSHLMKFSETFAVENGFSCIRLDAYTANPQALALYERRGYQRVGKVRFPRREFPFACFEKVL